MVIARNSAKARPRTRRRASNLGRGAPEARRARKSDENLLGNLTQTTDIMSYYVIWKVNEEIWNHDDFASWMHMRMSVQYVQYVYIYICDTYLNNMCGVRFDKLKPKLAWASATTLHHQGITVAWQESLV